MSNNAGERGGPAEQSGDVFLECIRRAELGEVRAVLARYGFGAGSRLLEVGGGNGWQARDLAQAGYQVHSVDVEPRPTTVFPVEIYDGRRLPCADASCDVVFSSNVLEHVPHIEEFQHELHRVLRPGGIAVHLMPTPTWRLATLLAHYPWLARAALSVASGSHNKDVAQVSGAAQRHSPLVLMSRVLLAPRHGEVGNAVSELWHFSARRWNALFGRHGWDVVEHRSNDLFYTGYSLLGPSLSFATRKSLARMLGGSCRLYVLKDARR
jgi:SAM-dependent methyltransferase